MVWRSMFSWGFGRWNRRQLDSLLVDRISREKTAMNLASTVRVVVAAERALSVCRNMGASTLIQGLKDNSDQYAAYRRPLQDSDILLSFKISEIVQIYLRFRSSNSLCLVRALCLCEALRKTGIPSDFVIGKIGSQQYLDTVSRGYPFHAWCEVAGNVLNDDPGCRDICHQLLRINVA